MGRAAKRLMLPGFGFRGGGTFNPDSISGLEMDYWAGDATTLFSDAGTTQAVADDTIQQWNDRKNARNLAQATANRRPQLKLVSGKYYVRTDTLAATNRFMKTGSSFTGIGARTVFFSGVLPAHNGANQSLLDGFDATHRNIVGGATAGTWRIYAGTGPVAGGTYASGAHVFCAIFNGASSALYVDGGAAALSGNAGSQTMTGISLCVHQDQSQDHISADVRRVLVYSGALSSANIDTVGAGLATDLGTTWTAVS